MRWSENKDILCNDEYSEAFGCFFLPFAVIMGTAFIWLTFKFFDPKDSVQVMFGIGLSLLFWGLALYLVLSPGVYVIDRSRMTLGHTMLFGRLVRIAKGGKVIGLRLEKSWHLNHRMTAIVAELEHGEAVVMKHGHKEYARQQFRKIAGFLRFTVSDDGREAA